MTGLVQTSSEATRSWSSSPLIVSRDSFSHQTWARFQLGGALPALFGCHYIYLCYNYHLCFTCINFYANFYDLLRLGWLLVCCLYKEVYLQIFKRVPFWLHGCCGGGKLGPVNQANNTSWVALVTPTDRPKSVHNRCIIELFMVLFVLSLCPYDISVGVWTFVIGLSQISSFFSKNCITRILHYELS